MNAAFWTGLGVMLGVVLGLVISASTRDVIATKRAEEREMLQLLLDHPQAAQLLGCQR